MLLPLFIEPMLARPAAPFDSDDHLFEIKWDGFRSLARVDKTLELIGRRRTIFTPDYPELAVLAGLPPGTMVDGEIVALVNGRPSFVKLLHRRRRSGLQVCFVAFDLLYERHESVMALPCVQRRQRLQRLIEKLASPRVLFSHGVIGDGKAYYDEAVNQQLEGVVAKRLDSPYEPGRRSGAWSKIKHRQQLTATIVGYEPSDRRPFKSLILATADEAGKWKLIGQVGSGFDSAMLDELKQELDGRLRKTPPVASKIRGRWVEPDLSCRVSFAEWTPDGQLRAPVFEGLVHDQAESSNVRSIAGRLARANGQLRRHAG